MAYNAEYDTYTTSLDNIGFSTQGNARYSYEVTAADTTTFAAEASGTLNGDADLWTIDEDLDLNNTTNACM